MGGYVAQESRRVVTLHTSVTETVLRTGKRAVSLGASDGHIQQASFLLKGARRIGTHRRRKYVLFHAYDKHHGELQSLGTMYGHQHHLRLVVGIVALYVRHQRHLLEKVEKVDMVGHTLLLLLFDEALHG